MSAAPLTAAQVVAGVDLAGATVVVTGATTGMGLATARALATAGAETVLLGRDQDRLDEAVRAVAAAARQRTHGVLAELADLNSVARAVDEIAATVGDVRILVNNAGVMFTPFGVTADGHELQFGTNHLGHFALTVGLEPLLGKGGARVVNLSSAGHKIAAPELDDLGWARRTYDKFAAYGASKTANIWFSSELDRRWADRGVRSFAVHPGTVATDLARHMDRDDFKTMAQLSAAQPGAAKRMSFATPEEGAATAVWAAVTPDLADRGGLYLADCAISEDVAPWAFDADRAAELWELSERWVSAPA
ncbi:SDR family NAD(P)-dependent oxidoreductase [Nocardioides sp. Bht2]|uniref:SDR family NAD(P)-dependent oxidoreductase n=1 Tax=Nocardioides sp. Bht2 TaxID=3392297 RepID=UPI0039B404AF